MSLGWLKLVGRTEGCDGRCGAAGETFLVEGVEQGMKHLTVRLSEGRMGRFSRTPRGVMLMIYEVDGGHMTYGLDEGVV